MVAESFPVLLDLWKHLLSSPVRKLPRSGQDVWYGSCSIPTGTLVVTCTDRQWAAALVLGAAKCGFFHDAKADLPGILVSNSLRHSRLPSKTYRFPTLDGHLHKSPPATC